MKISIVTSVYNESNYICDAIESVLGQDYHDIEYIIVDGGSTDGTVEKIMAYKDRAIIISEPDEGLYDALNKGICKATGDYIGFVHSNDMLYDTHVISDVADHIKKTQCDIFYGDGIFVENTKKGDKVVRKWIGGKYSKKKVASGWLPLHTTMFIRRETYLQNGLYDTSYRIAGDTHLLIRYFYVLDLKISYLHRMISRMRMGGVSTSIHHTESKWEEDVRAYGCYGFGRSVVVRKILRKIPQYLSQKAFYSSALRKVLYKLKITKKR